MRNNSGKSKPHKKSGELLQGKAKGKVGNTRQLDALKQEVAEIGLNSKIEMDRERGATSLLKNLKANKTTK
ncbi:hypothetical protein [Zhaonella formicivorans]|jgi:hypothetical protein|uniref:hypothetical protein n=1 Tax=Zhaonella formicivorans TaxID=2528593 RepID=UPI0010F31B97|nr:hypothetical protein [Zhaonella formicivorans]